MLKPQNVQGGCCVFSGSGCMVPTMASPFQGTLLVPGGDAKVGGCACGQSVGAGEFVVLVWEPAVRVIGCGVKGMWLERGARGACVGGEAGRAELQVLCAVCVHNDCVQQIL